MSDDEATKRGLGRGLAALLGDDAPDLAEIDRVRAAKDVPIEQLRPNPFQPRRNWDADQLQSLAQSIATRGVLQPILVRPTGDQAGGYEIIAGERRWRAAQIARLHQIPVLVKDVGDADSLELALIENVQRQDLAPLEEAAGYQSLISEFRYTQEQLARAVGKSRPHIANMLRLLGLPDAVKAMLDDGRLNVGAARALLTAEDPLKLAQEIVERGLNVRDIEQLRARRAPRPAPEKDADTRALEESLAAALGLKVTIRHSGERGGEVRIAYHSLEQLDEICRRLSRHGDDDLAPLAALDLGEDTMTAAEITAVVVEELAALDDDLSPAAGPSPVELMGDAIYRRSRDDAAEEAADEAPDHGPILER